MLCVKTHFNSINIYHAINLKFLIFIINNDNYQDLIYSLVMRIKILNI